MHLRELRIRNVKLIRDVELSFVREDGTPRPLTVIVGENGTCKSTVLQCIAFAAVGASRAEALARPGDAASAVALIDKRNADFSTPEWSALFGFAEAHHGDREYPALDPRGSRPPRVHSARIVDRSTRAIAGRSAYTDANSLGACGGADTLGHGPDLFDQVRGRDLPHWFVSGYGVTRDLPTPQSAPKLVNASIERLMPLFDRRLGLVGTDFIDRFDERRAYARTLKKVLIDGKLLPGFDDFLLTGRGGVTDPSRLIESHRFHQTGGARVPAVWMSHGYQSTVAWIADLVGQVLLEARDVTVEPDDMEGLCLVDEIDAHLHPAWQRVFLRRLKQVFPKMQFIATAHSPLVLASCDAGEVVVMRRDTRGDVRAERNEQAGRTLTADQLYEAFFDIRDFYPDEIGTKLQEYLRLAFDPYRSDDEDTRMHTLAAELDTDGYLPDAKAVERRP